MRRWAWILSASMLWTAWAGVWSCSAPKKCAVGTRQCLSTKVTQQCNALGEWEPAPCPSGMTCEQGRCQSSSSSEDGASSEQIPAEMPWDSSSGAPDAQAPCGDGALFVCIAGQRYLCESGRWVLSACQAGTNCQSGDCVGSTCQKDSRRCLAGRWLEYCDGVGWRNRQCAVGMQCTFGDCVPEPACKDGERRCFEGNQLQVCTGDRWSGPAPCPVGLACDNGQCKPVATCQEGSTRCRDASAVETCRNGAWQAASCPANQSCSQNKCTATTACNAGEMRCKDAKTREVCEAGAWKSTACAQGQTCQNGTCQTTAFSCTLPAATPTIATQFWQHPKSPYAGQTVTLSVRSDKVKVDQAPPLLLELTNRNGTRQIQQHTIIGGTTLYYLSAAGLTVGENCLVVKTAQGNVEVATKVIARDPGAGIARGNGVWKVTKHHQWTCAEQPINGNFLIVFVLDAQGKPVSGAKIRLGWTDDTVAPIKPDANAYDTHPKQLTTDGNGRAELWTPWGQGIRSPIDSKPGWLVFQLSVEGGASDTATEITTGLWESIKQKNGADCNYCSRASVNVYGHWSYTIEFQHQPNATEVCDVPTDHAGQSKCQDIPHAYHEVGKSSCVKVSP